MSLEQKVQGADARTALSTFGGGLIGYLTYGTLTATAIGALLGYGADRVLNRYFK